MRLVQMCIQTPVGPLWAISDGGALRRLCFVESEGDLSEGSDEVLTGLAVELRAYFAGALQRFSTPIAIEGTCFQKKAWQALSDIPYGQTRSYREQARMMGSPQSARAVGGANGANRFALLIPCHRVIGSDQKIGGYRGGVEKKAWLLAHEQRYR